MPATVRSHAKINLGLAIGAPRTDGFHGLATVYQTLEIHDLVTVSTRPAKATRLRLTTNDSRVPCDHRNTAWKIVSLALKELGISAEVSIYIEKRLPVQGGMGAGSANAVAALLGLERELGIGKTPGAPESALSLSKGLASETWESKKLEIASQVGSDVPLFLVGGTVLGYDRGQLVYPLPDLQPEWCTIALPATGVSTPQAFRDWDALCAAEGLTQHAGTDKLNKLSRAYLSALGAQVPEEDKEGGSSGVLPSLHFNREDLAGPPRSALVRTGITSWIENDFERVVFPQHPSLAEIKRLLAAPGSPEEALYAALSGSGSALFGLYKSRGDAEAAAHRLRQLENVEARITRTIPREDYWRGMMLA